MRRIERRFRPRLADGPAGRGRRKEARVGPEGVERRVTAPREAAGLSGSRGQGQSLCRPRSAFSGPVTCGTGVRAVTRLAVALTDVGFCQKRIRRRRRKPGAARAAPVASLQVSAR